ncbi:MAG: hypothetical protein A2Y24_05235 [Clostridiales bacterium GWE2_32_10]|nr:MAG: hypothetical protein A2Y24_05235 [Clostridiales bacterium GWE2_32_10]
MWMNGKVKKMIAWILVIAMILSVLVMATSVFAAGETFVSEKNEMMSFSIEEAMAYAKEHNYDLLSSQLDKDNIELSKKITEDLQDTLKDTYSLTKGAGDNFDTYKVRNGYAVMATKSAEKMLDAANTFKQKTTEMAVLSAYYALSEATMLLEQKKDTLKLINDQVKVCEDKLALGNVSELVYKTASLEKIGAEMAVTSAQADYDKALMSFNKILALPLDGKVTLTSKTSYEQYTLPDYDKKLEERKLEDLTYAQLLSDKELVEKEQRMAQTYYGARAPEYKQVVNKAKKNDISIEKQKAEIEYSLKADIKNIDVLQKSIKASQASIVLSNIILDITKVKNSLGMATELDVISAELDVESAQIKYIQAIHGYNTVILMFEKNIVG